jgi:hypothetical protein
MAIRVRLRGFKIRGKRPARAARAAVPGVQRAKKVKRASHEHDAQVKLFDD